MKHAPAFALLRSTIASARNDNRRRSSAERWVAAALCCFLFAAAMCAAIAYMRLDEEIANVSAKEAELKVVTAQRDEEMGLLLGFGYECELDTNNHIGCTRPSATVPHFIPNSATLPQVEDQ